jgi:protein TonB
MLQAAALEAVRNARYRPYLLNQQPTEVETTFSINFHLGS